MPLHGFISIDTLPSVNACLNSLSTIFLFLGYYFIRAEKKELHAKCMISAFVTSTIFLISYLIYHFNTGHTTFQDPSWFKPIYLSLLFSHILLAVVIVPLIIAAFIFAFKKNWSKHKAVVKWTWPLWIYVSITGVTVYFILYHIFPQSVVVE